MSPMWLSGGFTDPFKSLNTRVSTPEARVGTLEEKVDDLQKSFPPMRDEVHELCEMVTVPESQARKRLYNGSPASPS